MLMSHACIIINLSKIVLIFSDLVNKLNNDIIRDSGANISNNVELDLSYCKNKELKPKSKNIVESSFLNNNSYSINIERINKLNEKINSMRNFSQISEDNFVDKTEANKVKLNCFQKHFCKK
jgi:hypothetical protein